MKEILRDAFNEVMDVTDSMSISFQCDRQEDHFIIYANEVTLNNHDDDIRIEIAVNDGGGATFYAVFDKLDETPTTLRLLNEFNEDTLFFSAYIGSKGYLTLRHFTIWNDPKELKAFANEALSRLGGMADNEILQRITKYTS